MDRTQLKVKRVEHCIYSFINYKFTDNLVLHFPPYKNFEGILNNKTMRAIELDIIEEKEQINRMVICFFSHLLSTHASLA